jgi:hypothetical protein
MPYRTALNRTHSLAVSDRSQLIREMDTLRAELNDVRTKYAALLAKLDLDGGVTDTNYAATVGLAAAQFTA